MTPQDLVEKIDYEGGIYEAVAGYGLSKDSLTKATPAQQAAWSKVVDLAIQLRNAVDKMKELFPDVGDGEESEDD